MIAPTDPDPKQPLSNALGNARQALLGWLARARAVVSRAGGGNSQSLAARLDAHLRTSDRAPITVAAIFGAGLVGLGLLIALVVSWNRVPERRTVVVPPTAEAIQPAMATTSVPTAGVDATMPPVANAEGTCARHTVEIQPGECTTLKLDEAARGMYKDNVSAIYLVHDDATKIRKAISIDDRFEVCPTGKTTYAWDIRLRPESPEGRGKVAWCETTIEVIAGLTRP